MTTFNASTDTAYFHCLQEERMRQAQHQRLVRQALQYRRDRIKNPKVQSGFRQAHRGQPLSGTVRS